MTAPASTVALVIRRVAATVRRDLCFSEKSSTDAAKERADAVPLRFTVSDYQSGVGPGTFHSPLKVLFDFIIHQAVEELCVPPFAQALERRPVHTRHID